MDVTLGSSALYQEFRPWRTQMGPEKLALGARDRHITVHSLIVSNLGPFSPGASQSMNHVPSIGHLHLVGL
jgi:hypothetical protein